MGLKPATNPDVEAVAIELSIDGKPVTANDGVSLYDVIFNVAFVAAAAVAAAALPLDGKSYAVLSVVAAGYLATGLGYAAATRTRTRTPVPAGSSGGAPAQLVGPASRRS